MHREGERARTGTFTGSTGNVALSCFGRKQTSALAPTVDEELRNSTTNSHLAVTSQHLQPAFHKNQHARGSLTQNVADACSEKPLVSMVTGYVRGTSRICTKDEQDSSSVEFPETNNKIQAK